MREGIDLTIVAVMAAAFIGWALVAVRLERWNIPTPIFFVVVGLVVSYVPVEALDVPV